MGKNIAIRIHTIFASVFCPLCFCKNVSVAVRDRAAYNLFRKIILPLIVWVIDHRFCTHHIKIDKIPHQGKKQDHKKVGDSSELFV